jgi:hypothetical protein
MHLQSMNLLLNEQIECGNGVLEFQKSLVQTRYQQTDR